MPAVCLERATIISDQSHIILRNITMLITLLIVFPLSVILRGYCCSRIILLYYVPVPVIRNIILSNLLFPLYLVLRSRYSFPYYLVIGFPYYNVILRSILRIVLRRSYVPVIVPVIVRIYLVVLLSNIT